MTPLQIGILAVVAVVVLYAKGYIGLPSTKPATSSNTEEMARAFLKALQAEAQDEVASLIAGKMKEDVKAKLQSPFGVASQEPPQQPPK